MSDNLSVTVSKCMDAVREHVGTVELEKFIYYIRSGSFDYTEWQREYYDDKTPEEIFASIEQHSTKKPFHGKKATII